jgi:putative sugar O-methyltransferase
MDTQKNELREDIKLLEAMLNDSNNQAPVYQPGRYWQAKAKNSAHEIKRCGLSGFRGSKNLIGLSYADNLFMDIRDSFNHGLKKRFVRWITKTYPLSPLFDAQVRWTESYANASIRYAEEFLNLKERAINLLKQYKMPHSLLGNCMAKARICGQDVSLEYLNTLEQHDNIAQHIDFNAAESVFEIGGGFGTRIHLLLENYKNIRKVLYLDIPPNLYVGTQYLRAFYGAAVSDYRDLKTRDLISFSKDDSLEIFCIAPWQIENFRSPVDIFLNSHSFVEMPAAVVKNYVDKFGKLPNSSDSAVALATYDSHDPSTTLAPAELPKFFKDRKFDFFEAEKLLDSKRKNLFYISPGKFARKPNQ